MRSRRSSRFSPCFGGDSRDLYIAAHSSAAALVRELAEHAVRVGAGKSILVTATTIGTSAARACEMDSLVWGITPIVSATTSTAMSNK